MNRETLRIRHPEQTKPRLLPLSPALHTDDSVHDAAGASPRALRCSAHLQSGRRHGSLRDPVAVGGGSEPMGPVSPVFAP